MPKLIEDQVANQLDRDEITVEEAVALFDGDSVLVYPSMDLDPATATWEEIEERGASHSHLFHMLTIKGASEEQMDHVGAQMIRLRAQGNVIEV